MDDYKGFIMSNKNLEYYSNTYIVLIFVIFGLLLCTFCFNTFLSNAFAKTDKFNIPNSDIKITIERPSGWNIDRSLPDYLAGGDVSDDNFIGVYYSPETNDHDLVVSEIRFFKFPLNESSPDINTLMQNDITDSINSNPDGNFKLLKSSSNFSLDGYPGFTYAFTTNDENKILRFIEVSAIIVNSNLYEIIALTDANKEDKYLPILNQIMLSFKIDDPSAHSLNAFNLYSDSSVNVNDNFTIPGSGTSVSIERPYNWIKNDTLPESLKENGISNENFIVMYNSPEINDKGYYTSEIRFFKFPLALDEQDINTLMQNNIQASKSINNNFQLISSSSNFSLDGYPGFTYTFTGDTGYGTTSTVTVATVVVNSVMYDIQYVTDTDKQDRYLPILNKIVQSFKISTNLNLGDNMGLSSSNSSKNIFFTFCDNSLLNQNQGTDSPDAIGSFTYENSFYGLKFSHSKSWKVVECNDHIEIVPSLSSSSLLSSGLINADNPVAKLSIGLLNLTPDENPFTSYLNYLNSTNGQTLQLLEFKPFAYKGLPAYRITTIYYDYDEGSWKKEMSIFAPSDNLLYLFKYNTKEGLYSKYLSAITKMLNSIVFIQNQPSSSETSPIDPSLIPPSITGGA